MKLTQAQIDKLNGKMAELATVMSECGYDCSEEDIFAYIIDKLDENIEEFS